jgi:hypothetical protein
MSFKIFVVSGTPLVVFLSVHDFGGVFLSFSALLQACDQQCCRLPSVALVVFSSSSLLVTQPKKYYFHSLPKTYAPPA